MIDYSETICAKIKTCLREIQQTVETGHMNPQLLAKTLVAIQSDAIKMENALKANKVLREKHGIDAEYREMMHEASTPSDVNTIDNINAYTKETPRFELTMADEDGNILYHHWLHAFVMCSVEKISDIDSAGIINGVTDTFAVGNDLAMWYAFDQLQQKFAGKLTELMVKMANTKREGKFMNRTERRKLIKAANRGRK